MDVRVGLYRKLSAKEFMLYELWCWKRLLRVPWTARSNQSILKEISSEYSPFGKHVVSFPASCLFKIHSVQFSRSVVSDSLPPHELQHTRPPCPSPTPGVNPNSCPLSQWCHPAISSSLVPFSCPRSFLASGSFQTSQLFASSGQSIAVSASASVLPMNTVLISFRIDWLDLLAVQESLIRHL